MAAGGTTEGRSLAAGPQPQAQAGGHHGHTQPLAHAQAQRQRPEEAVGLAEVLGCKAEHAIADQEDPRHLARGPRPAGVQPQQHEEQQAFEQKLVDLAGVARDVGARLRKHHGPGQARVGRTAPQLAVDEIADTPTGQPGGHARRNQVGHLQPGPATRAGIGRHGDDHAQHAAVERHAALPHHQDFQRVGQVVAGLVEQGVAEAPAQHHAQHAPEQQVFHITPAPAGIGVPGLARARRRQGHEQAEGHQVGQAVPVDLHRAQ
jgi:hypothetical protein